MNTLPARLFRTFTLARPLGGAFWRDAACSEVDCPRWRNGWRSVFDLTTVDGVKMSKWINAHSGRAFTYEQTGNVLTFTFAAGQACFEKHRTAVEREPLYVVRNGRNGDYAGQATKHTRGEFWRDDMQENLGRVAEDRERWG